MITKNSPAESAFLGMFTGKRKKAKEKAEADAETIRAQADATRTAATAKAQVEVSNAEAAASKTGYYVAVGIVFLLMVGLVLITKFKSK